MNKWFSDLQFDIKKIWTEPFIKGPPSSPVSCLCKGKKFVFLCFYPPSSPLLFSLFYFIFHATQCNYISLLLNVINTQTSSCGCQDIRQQWKSTTCCLCPRTLLLDQQKAILQILRHKLMLTNSRASSNDTSSLCSRSCHGPRSHHTSLLMKIPADGRASGEHVRF